MGAAALSLVAFAAQAQTTPVAEPQATVTAPATLANPAPAAPPNAPVAPAAAPAPPLVVPEVKKVEIVLPALPVVVEHVLPSLFFTPSEKEAIIQAKQQYLERVTTVESEADLLDQLQGIKSAKRQEDDLQDQYYAQFYLETLMYHTPNDWTVWVKDKTASKKYVPDMPVAATDELKIIVINKEEVTFEWRPRGWHYILAHYKGDNPLVQLDKNRQMVIFTLRVNETMSAYDMQIKQGVVSVVRVAADTTPLEKTAPPPAANTPAAAAPSVPPSGSVLDLYKTLEPVDKKP